MPVRVGLGQVALGIGGLESQPRQIGGMLEETTAILGPLTERGIDQPLTDDGVL